MIFHDADEFTLKWWIFNSLRNIFHSIDFFLTLVNKLFSLNFFFIFSWTWLSLASFYLFLRLTSLQILLILFPIFIHHFVLPLFKMNFNTNKCGSGRWPQKARYMWGQGPLCYCMEFIDFLTLSLYCSFQGQQSLLYGCRVQLYTLKFYSNFAEHLYSPNQSRNLFLTNRPPTNQSTDRPTNGDVEAPSTELKTYRDKKGSSWEIIIFSYAIDLKFHS